MMLMSHRAFISHIYSRSLRCKVLMECVLKKRDGEDSEGEGGERSGEGWLRRDKQETEDRRKRKGEKIE